MTESRCLPLSWEIAMLTDLLLIRNEFFNYSKFWNPNKIDGCQINAPGVYSRLTSLCSVETAYRN